MRIKDNYNIHHDIYYSNLSRFLLILVLCLIFTPNSVDAQVNSDQYKPYLHNPSVGDVPEMETFGEYQTEVFVGAGNYKYSINNVPGAVSLQPYLSLYYNSQTVLQHPSLLGSGWSLTENYISRDVNHTVNQTSDDYFILLLGDSRLKLIYNGSTYNTEINPRHYKVQNLTTGGRVYWVVTTTDGTQYRFGFNNDSRLDSNAGMSYDVKWSLDLVQDTHNNSIFYTYRENPFAGDVGAVYLSNITYNNDRLRVISFAYESQSRPDRRLVFEEGNMVDESRRLKDISILYNSSLVRRYSLNYATLNGTLTSVSNISYIGSDNSSVLNTVKFDYYNPTQGFDNTTGKWVIPSAFAFSSTDVSGKDFGVRLLDVNNDGFPDLVRANGTRETRLNNKINGWNTTTLFAMPVDVVSTNLDQGVRFEDVNSDGLVDILKAKAGTSREVYLNNGTGWASAASWVIPIDFIASDSKDLGVELVDLNGDGRVDILKANTTTKAAYLNNGTGWASTSSFVSPDNFTTGDNKDTGLRIVDLNNDGLPDLLKGGVPGNAWFNNGTGWQNNSGYAPGLEFTDQSGDRPDLGVRFMDINGDGLQDLLQNFYSNVSIINQTCVDQNGTNCTLGQNITFATNTKLNNGSGWVQASGWNSPERFTDQGLNIGRRIADVNGDGYADIVVAYQQSPYLGVTHLKNATNAFLLKFNTNAYGGKTELTYKQSTLSDNGDDLGFNIWLVSNFSLNNNLSGDFAAGSLYSYLYRGGKYDYQTQEFRGFGEVNETLPDNSIVSHSFHQDAILKGREFKTSVYSSTGKHFVDSLSIFTNSSDKTIFLNKTSTQIYDGEPTPSVNNISYSYDLYGNVNLVNNSGDLGVSGDEKIEMYEYFYNTTAYIVGKPSNYTLFASDGSTIVKRVFYAYDGLTSGVTKGDLTKVTNYNNKGSNPVIQYTYDSFGNVIKETQPLGQNTTFTYDSTGTFKIKDTNHLGHTVSYAYDLGTGNILNETRHGMNKTYTYDTFGRIKTEVVSPDTLASPTKNYTYNLDGSAPETIKIQTKNNASDYSESLYFYDGFSNLVETKTLLGGQQIVKNYFYDSKYRIDEEQNPYFESYTTSLSTATNGLKAKYQYDSLDRVINLTKQDNSSLIVIFNKTLVIQFDENGNRIDYIIDGLNRIKTVSEYNGTGVYNTTYDYRTDDNLIKITDTKSNKFLFDYDTLGRKIVYDDPNMNNWTYFYDSNGNLVNQTDGRNVTTFLTYDGLNRVTFKKAGTSNITFVYDKQFNGTLTNITADDAYFSVVYNKYSYDSRLRIIEEDVYSCYREVNPGTDECEWTNYSSDYDSQDRIIKMYLPNTNLNYTYNDIGKLESAQGFLSAINYNAFGKALNKTYSNGLVTKISYDSLSRINNLQTGSIQNLTYGYDSVGNIKSINDTKNSKKYTMQYDALNRLINTNITNMTNQSDVRVFNYVYDAISNLLFYYTNDKNITYSYSSLAHAPTSLVVEVSVPFVNITTCGNLTVPNTVYALDHDYNVTGNCFTIQASNITLDGAGHTISGNHTSQGILITSSTTGTIIKNVTIKNFDHGISFTTGGQLSVNILDVNTFLNDLDGIELAGGDYHVLKNINSSYNNQTGLDIHDANTVNLSNIFVSHNSQEGLKIDPAAPGIFIPRPVLIILLNTTSLDNGNDGLFIKDANSTLILDIISRNNAGDGIDLELSSNSNITNAILGNNGNGIRIKSNINNVIVKDSNISSVIMDSNARNNIFLNTTYSTENVSSGSQLIRKWYYRAFTNDTSGNNVSGANVTAYNVTGSYQFNLTTNTSGFTPLTEIIDYINNGGTKTYYSNYTLFAAHSSYSPLNHSRNITLLTNIYQDIFTFLASGQDPTIEFVNPTPLNGSNQTQHSVYVNVTSSSSEDHYDFIDFDNDVVLWMTMDETDGSDNPLDLSSYGNDGTKSGYANQQPSGQWGSRFNFGDSEHGWGKVTIPSDSSLEFDSSGKYTWSMWIAPEDYGDPDDEYIVMEMYGAQESGFGIRINSTGVQVLNHAQGEYIEGTTAIPAREWVNLVITYDNQEVDGYMNGVWRFGGTQYFASDNSDIVLGHGTDTISGNDKNFTGNLDDVIIFNRVLDAEEIYALYSAPDLYDLKNAPYWQHNFTGLSTGQHTFKGYAVNALGDIGETEERIVTII